MAGEQVEASATRNGLERRKSTAKVVEGRRGPNGLIALVLKPSPRNTPNTTPLQSPALRQGDIQVEAEPTGDSEPPTRQEGPTDSSDADESTPIRPRPTPTPTPTPVTDLIIVPRTVSEWKAVIHEVKHLYFCEQHEECTARCIQLLNNISDPSRVEPLHIVCLCFYAATGLEIKAEALEDDSLEKIPLLQDALAKFGKAAVYLEYAKFATTTNPRITQAAKVIIDPDVAIKHRSFASNTDSFRSSVESVFSIIDGDVTEEMRLPSPRFPSPQNMKGVSQGGLRRRNSSSSSVGSTITARPACDIRSAPLRIKKKVSFSMTPGDSPISPSSPTASYLVELDSFPLPPTNPRNSISYAIPSTPPIFEEPESYYIEENSNSPTTPTYPEKAATTSVPLNLGGQPSYLAHLTEFSATVNKHSMYVGRLVYTIQNSREARQSNSPTLLQSLSAADLNGLEDQESREAREIERKKKRHAEVKKRIDVIEGRGWKRRGDVQERIDALRARAERLKLQERERKANGTN